MAGPLSPAACAVCSEPGSGRRREQPLPAPSSALSAAPCRLADWHPGHPFCYASHQSLNSSKQHVIHTEIISSVFDGQWRLLEGGCLFGRLCVHFSAGHTGSSGVRAERTGLASALSSALCLPFPSCSRSVFLCLLQGHMGLRFQKGGGRKLKPVTKCCTWWHVPDKHGHSGSGFH